MEELDAKKKARVSAKGRKVITLPVKVTQTIGAHDSIKGRWGQKAWQWKIVYVICHVKRKCFCFDLEQATKKGDYFQESWWEDR